MIWKSIPFRSLITLHSASLRFQPGTLTKQELRWTNRICVIRGFQVTSPQAAQHNRFLNHSAPSEFLYLSKTAASGDIEAMIPHGGAYYLIFDNSASDSSVKVKADVTVRYETVQVDSHDKVR